MVNFGTRIKAYTYQQGASTVNTPQWTNPIMAAAVRLVNEDGFYGQAQAARGNEEIENVQFVVSPPVDIAQFMVFLRELKGIIPGNIMKITGSYQEGCAVTVVLPEPQPHSRISAILRDLSRALGIEVVLKEYR